MCLSRLVAFPDETSNCLGEGRGVAALHQAVPQHRCCLEQECLFTEGKQLTPNSYQTRVIGPINVHLGSAVGHMVIPFLHLLSRGVAAKVFLTPLLWAGKAVTQGAPFKTLPTASHSNMRKCWMNIYS